MYGIRLQNYLSLGLPYQPLINTTLNEKFIINQDYIVPDNVYPKTNVIVIGTDFNPTNSDLTRVNLKLSPHTPLDAALFKHIPFYLRKLTDVKEYPPSDHYVLRKEITIDNETYLACYGYHTNDIVYKGDIVKYANIDTDYVNITKVETNTGEYLSPTLRDNLDIDKSLDYFLGNFFKLAFFFDSKELIEIGNSFDILYPNQSLRRITEIGVCSSIYLEGDNEVVATTIDYFLDSDFNIDDKIKEGNMEFYLEVGNSEVIRGWD